jgi:uncharacterized membrane protein YkvA (DUF1232 family)
MATTHGVRGWRDWRFWVVLSLYALAGALFFRSFYQGRWTIAVVPALATAFLAMSAIAWDYRLLGSPKRYPCLVLHVCLGIVLFLFINSIVFTFGDALSFVTGSVLQPIMDNFLVKRLIGSDTGDWLRDVTTTALAVVYSVILFLLVCVFLIFRRDVAVPLLVLAFVSLTGLTILFGWFPFAWIAAGAALVFIAMILQREDERQRAFWSRVHEHLSEFGHKRPRIDTLLKLDLLRRLFHKGVLGEPELRRLTAQRLNCRPDALAVAPACRQTLEELNSNDDLLELRADARGQYVALRESATEDDMYRRMALYPRLFIVALFTVAYQLWPWDLIPDSIPFLGAVDDLVVVVVGGMSCLSSSKRLHPEHAVHAVGADGFLKAPKP